MACFYRGTHVLKGCCSSRVYPLIQIVRFITPRHPDNINPQDEKDLPEFVYATENSKASLRLYIMGNIMHGALGVPNFMKMVRPIKYIHRPQRVPFAEENKVHDFSCGYGFTVMAVQNKDFACFGMGLCQDSQIGAHTLRNGKQLEMTYTPAPIKLPLQSGSKIRKVSCGRAHTMVCSNKQEIWTFGNNAYGQCGRPIIPDEDYFKHPFYHKIPTFTGQNIEQIECGQDSSYVLSGGVIYSCGWSADGQSGRDTYENVDSFGPIEGDLKGEKVVKISSLGDCVLALTEMGDVFGWGNSEYRQLGMVTEEQQCSTPKKLNLNIGKIIDVGAAGTTCYALTDSGDVWSWGYGILGRGPNETFSKYPKLIPSTLLGRNILNKDSKVKKIFCGLTMAAAVTNNGSLYTWGRNAHGNLGLGHTNTQTFPLRVCIAGIVHKVSCGIDHMAALTSALL